MRLVLERQRVHLRYNNNRLRSSVFLLQWISTVEPAAVSTSFAAATIATAAFTTATVSAATITWKFCFSCCL